MIYCQRHALLPHETHHHAQATRLSNSSVHQLQNIRYANNTLRPGARCDRHYSSTHVLKFQIPYTETNSEQRMEARLQKSTHIFPAVSRIYYVCYPSDLEGERKCLEFLYVVVRMVVR